MALTAQEKELAERMAQELLAAAQPLSEAQKAKIRSAVADYRRALSKAS